MARVTHPQPDKGIRVDETVESLRELLTLDELTNRVGMSVRNVRFYTTKGLVPPPIRRGRSGYYTPDHVARLELVQELQSHGFTLAAIEKYVAGIPATPRPRTSPCTARCWRRGSPRCPVELTRADLDRRTGRKLTDADLVDAGRPRHRAAHQARPLRGRPLPALGRDRPARPRLPDRGRARGRRRVRRARPPDRRGALRAVPDDGLAATTRSPGPARSDCRSWSSGSSRCRSRAWWRRTKPRWTRRSARGSPAGRSRPTRPGPRPTRPRARCAGSRPSTSRAWARVR